MKEYKALNRKGNYLEFSIGDVFLVVEYTAECVEEIYKDMTKCKMHDNKTVYEIVTENDKTIYAMYYDNYIYFGLSIKEGYLYSLYHREED